MLVVYLEEHRRNFRRLTASSATLANNHSGADQFRAQASLLKFYAAEVGLKYLLNLVEKIPFKYESNGAKPFVETFSHRLPDMVAQLKVPASRISGPTKSRYQCVGGYDDGTGGQFFDLAASHEAWRYGLKMEASDEAEIDAYLDAVVQYLDEEISV